MLDPNVIQTTLYKVTYEELCEMIEEETLITGAGYLLTDFQTIYIQPKTLEVKEGEIEPLILVANSPSTIALRATSTIYTSDILEYIVDGSEECEWNVHGESKGQIIYRRDSVYENEAPYDFRSILSLVSGVVIPQYLSTTERTFSFKKDDAVWYWYVEEDSEREVCYRISNDVSYTLDDSYDDISGIFRWGQNFGLAGSVLWYNGGLWRRNSSDSYSPGLYNSDLLWSVSDFGVRSEIDSAGMFFASWGKECNLPTFTDSVECSIKSSGFETEIDSERRYLNNWRFWNPDTGQIEYSIKKRRKRQLSGCVFCHSKRNTVSSNCFDLILLQSHHNVFGPGCCRNNLMLSNCNIFENEVRDVLSTNSHDNKFESRSGNIIIEESNYVTFIYQRENYVVKECSFLVLGVMSKLVSNFLKVNNSEFQGTGADYRGKEINVSNSNYVYVDVLMADLYMTDCLNFRATSLLSPSNHAIIENYFRQCCSVEIKTRCHSLSLTQVNFAVIGEESEGVLINSCSFLDIAGGACGIEIQNSSGIKLGQYCGSRGYNGVQGISITGSCSGIELGGYNSNSTFMNSSNIKTGKYCTGLNVLDSSGIELGTKIDWFEARYVTNCKIGNSCVNLYLYFSTNIEVESLVQSVEISGSQNWGRCSYIKIGEMTRYGRILHCQFVEIGKQCADFIISRFHSFDSSHFPAGVWMPDFTQFPSDNSLSLGAAFIKVGNQCRFFYIIRGAFIELKDESFWNIILESTHLTLGSRAMENFFDTCNSVTFENECSRFSMKKCVDVYVERRNSGRAGTLMNYPAVSDFSNIQALQFSMSRVRVLTNTFPQLDVFGKSISNNEIVDFEKDEGIGDFRDQMSTDWKLFRLPIVEGGFRVNPLSQASTIRLITGWEYCFSYLEPGMQMIPVKEVLFTTSVERTFHQGTMKWLTSPETLVT